MLLLDCDVQHSLALTYDVPNKANMGKDEAWPTLEVEGNLLALLSSAQDSCMDGDRFCLEDVVIEHRS